MLASGFAILQDRHATSVFVMFILVVQFLSAGLRVAMIYQIFISILRAEMTEVKSPSIVIVGNKRYIPIFIQSQSNTSDVSMRFQFVVCWLFIPSHSGGDLILTVKWRPSRKVSLLCWKGSCLVLCRGHHGGMRMRRVVLRGALHHDLNLLFKSTCARRA